MLNTDILVLAFRIVHGKWLDICKTNEDKYGTEYREWLMSNDNKIRYKSFGFNDILNQVMEYILVYADIKVETEEINVEESAIPEVMEVMDKKNDKLQVIEEEFDIESLPVLTRNIVDVIKHHIESNTYGKANELLATAYKMKELDKFMPALKHLYNIQMEIYNHKIQSMPHNEKFSVIYISGMSPKYKELIKDRTILEHWYKFYEELHNTEEGKLPFFNFHYEYIETFAYDFLNPAN